MNNPDYFMSKELGLLLLHLTLIDDFQKKMKGT